MVELSLTKPLKLGLPSLALGIIFFLVAFGVDFWLSAEWQDYEFDGGLWKACLTDSDRGFTRCTAWSSDDLDSLRKGWMQKNQALQCLALVLLIGSLGGLVVFFLTKLKAAIVTAFLTAFMAAFFAILGCALFASDMSSDSFYSYYGNLGWAFGFSIVGAIFLAGYAVALVIHLLFFSTTTNSSSSSTSRAATTIFSIN